MHPCESIYKAAGQTPTIDGVRGVCRITGKDSQGVPFNKWVKDTFTDHAYLSPGDIISFEALFCFEEQSTLLQEKTQRDKPQRFRTYSHIVTEDGSWQVLTKANKREIFHLLAHTKPELVCLTDSGQKHILFKHRVGFWQLDETFIQPNAELLVFLHEKMLELLALGFSQTEIQSGKYYHARVLKAVLKVWHELEGQISSYRGKPIFDLAAWLMYNDK